MGRGRLPALAYMALIACNIFSVMRMEHLFFDRPHHATGANWCDAVREARSDLTPELKITVPCETMKPAKSAVVCFLTAGVADGQGNHKVFTGSDYINGALALGASLQDHITRKDTHQLLLIRPRRREWVGRGRWSARRRACR